MLEPLTKTSRKDRIAHRKKKKTFPQMGDKPWCLADNTGSVSAQAAVCVCVCLYA